MTGNLMRRLAVVALPLALAACDPNDWLTDMKQQPSIGTWQKFSSDSAAGDTIPFRGNPQGSVPTHGLAVASWQVSYAVMPATIEAVRAYATIGEIVAVLEQHLGRWQPTDAF